MDWFERVIVGSGPSGVAAALRLEEAGTCLVDAGEVPDFDFPYPSLQEAISDGAIADLLGPEWELLRDLTDPTRTHIKLRSIGLGFVMRGDSFRIEDRSGGVLNRGAGSLAAGGMSNVWGGQLLRYTNDDLKEAGDWPFSASELEKYYHDLEEHIGISGEIDDMQEFLGGGVPSLPPVPMVPAAAHLYRTYRASSGRAREKEAPKLIIGRPRVAVATAPYRNRPAYNFGETEFFTTRQPGFYTARLTLEELKSGGRITYLPGFRLMDWQEKSEYIELSLRELSTGDEKLIRTRHLLIGCGATQTARLVIGHYRSYDRMLPFMDHPPALLPLFLPLKFGSELPEKSFPIQLIGTLPGTGRRDMISFYYPGGILWSSLIGDVPLPMDSAVRIMRGLLGGMLVAQIWQTSRPSPGNRLGMKESGEMVVRYPERSPCTVVPPLLRAMFGLGAFSIARLASLSPPGWGFHYAGCLPMRRTPGDYETHIDGRLWDSRRVRLIDGSILPSLPAKNHALTLMANAARIADEVKKCGY
ncbi:MAG: GMC family oxidoreductase [Acidobacteria bacterium]|nr:GMC family oxidoreductase [Acidobacteriota bacterium]